MRRYRKLLILCLLAAISAPIFAQLSKTNNGLTMSFKIYRQRYKASEPIELQMALTNSYHDTLNYEFVNTPPCDFWVKASNGREIWRYSKSRPFYGKTSLKLKPRESKTYRVTWNQVDDRGKAVEPGWYDVYGKFSRADRYLEPFHSRIRIEEKPSTPVVIIVPTKSNTIDPVKDVGKSVTVEGVLRRGTQGLYIDVRNIKVKR